MSSNGPRCQNSVGLYLNSWSVEVLVTELCLTLCCSADCSPPGSSVLGILQAGILEWVAISYSRGFSPPKDWTHVSLSRVSCIGRQSLYRALASPGKPTETVRDGRKSVYLRHTSQTQTVLWTVFVFRAGIPVSHSSPRSNPSSLNISTFCSLWDFFPPL